MNSLSSLVLDEVSSLDNCNHPIDLKISRTKTQTEVCQIYQIWSEEELGASPLWKRLSPGGAQGGLEIGTGCDELRHCQQVDFFPSEKISELRVFIVGRVGFAIPIAPSIYLCTYAVSHLRHIVEECPKDTPKRSPYQNGKRHQANTSRMWLKLRILSSDVVFKRNKNSAKRFFCLIFPPRRKA